MPRARRGGHRPRVHGPALRCRPSARIVHDAACSTSPRRASRSSRSRSRRATSSGAAARAARVDAPARVRNVPTTGGGSTPRASIPTTAADSEDLAKFPFTTKADLREDYPFGMFAVPRERVARIHASSGTTGQPTVVGYTEQDLDTWADLMARSIRAAGGRPGDRVHVAYGYGLFTGGLGAHYGAERLGCTVIPVSGGHDRAPGAADPRLRARHHHGDALVHAHDPRRARAAGRGPARLLVARSASSARSRGPRTCAPRSRPASTCTRSTSTGCPR